MAHAFITGIIDLQNEMEKIMQVPGDYPYTTCVMSLEYVSK
jgi:hypothetical protein